MMGYTMQLHVLGKVTTALSIQVTSSLACQDTVNPCLALKGQHLQFPHACPDSRMRHVLKFRFVRLRGEVYVVLQHIFARPPVKEHKTSFACFVDNQDGYPQRSRESNGP